MIYNQYSVSHIRAYLAQIYGAASLVLNDQSFAANFGTMTANVPESLPVQIPANSDFLLLEIAVATTELLLSKSKIQISDSTSGETFFNVATPVSAVCTIESTLSQLPWPRFVQGNTTLYVTLTPDATTTSPVIVSLLGVGIRKG
jgi:hypothetical protein